MKQESGRSLIEVIGVMALAAIAIVGTFAAYNALRNRQVRTIATATLEQIAKDTKLLFSARGDYSGVSVEYLIYAGALKNDKPPIGSADWSVASGFDGRTFSINLNGLSKSDCDYFTNVRMEWVQKIKVNGYESDPGAYCLNTGDNKISFVVE